MFASARRPASFQVDVSPVDNSGSSSTGVWARPPLREFSTGCSQASPPGIRESMLSQGTTPGCLRPDCWRARLPVASECAAGARLRPLEREFALVLHVAQFELLFHFDATDI